MAFEPVLSRRAALTASFAAGLAVFGPACADPADDPVATVKALQDGLLNVLLKTSTLTAQQRFDALQPAIAAAFDLPGMARLCYGANWDGLTAEQQAGMAQALGDYVAASYAARFEDLQTKGFERDATTAQRGEASVVTTRMLLVSGPPLPIDYVMRKTPKGWLVADILSYGSISELAGWRGAVRGLAASGGAQAVIDGLHQRTSAFLTP